VDVVLEVAAETADPLAQHGDLDLRGTGVGAVGLVGVDQLLLLGGIKRHARGAALSVQTMILPGQGSVDDINLMQALSQASSSSPSCGPPMPFSRCRASRISWVSKPRVSKVAMRSGATGSN